MRRTLIALAAAGLLAATGCSDSDSGGGEAASGGSSVDAFCDAYDELNERFSADPEAAADMDEVIGAFEDLDPPEEIAEDFDLVLEVARESVETDPEDTEAVEDLESMSEEASAADERVGTFISDECGPAGDDDDGASDETTVDDAEE